MKNVRKYIEWLFPFIVVFLACIYTPIDPDLGWHLKNGEYFFRTGQVLRDNILSSEMPDYKWANIAWGIDLINYGIYQLGGFFALSLAGALTATLTFFFFSKAYKLDYWQQAIIFPFLLYLLSTIHRNSFRGQLVSIMMLGLLMYLLTSFGRGNKKALYFVPFVILLWANLHGLFILGICVLLLWEGLFLLSNYLQERSIKELIPDLKLLVPVTLVTLLVPLIHPFGIGVYVTAIEHFDSPLLDMIAEYNAVSELSSQWYNLIIVGALVAIGVAVSFIKKTLYSDTPNIGLFSVLYYLSFSVRKYLWAMYYFIIPFLTPIADFVRPDTKKGTFIGATSIFCLTLIVISIIKYPYSQFTTMSWESYCEQIINCSQDSVNALKKYYKKDKTMTPYAWGGYIIWNNPDIRPSTDGRMSVWTDKSGYSAFQYTYMYEWDKFDVDGSKYDVVLAARNRPIYKRLEGHAEQGSWKKVYTDESAGIFVRTRRD